MNERPDNPREQRREHQDADAPMLARMRVRSVPDSGDHLVCRHYDGSSEGSEDILVAKPWTLRRTPWEGGAITYASGQDRTVSGEVQQIGPRPYTAGDEIVAARGVLGGIQTAADELVWIDLNLDARCWVRVCA